MLKTALLAGANPVLPVFFRIEQGMVKGIYFRLILNCSIK